MEITTILKDLIGFKSLTPNDDGAISYCSKFLENIGFDCKILEFCGVKNLYAKYGKFKKNICFAGHIDVVPPLNESKWNSNPFEAHIKDNKIFGRGANDMKGPLASCLYSIKEFINNNKNNINFSISVMLTSDEEIMGDYGTKSIINYLSEKNEDISLCVLCESCSNQNSGEYIKIGCRGSLNVNIKSIGTQCHVVSAPNLGNHIHNLICYLNNITTNPLDNGNDIFPPSSLQITSIDIGNNTRNIVPREASVMMNIRFNDIWNFERLEEYLINTSKKFSNDIHFSFERFGNAFIGADQKSIFFLQKSIENTIGIKPGYGVLGGNSDALFIKDITNVVEIGSPISIAHTINEYIEIEDLEKLYRIYYNIIQDFNNYS